MTEIRFDNGNTVTIREELHSSVAGLLSRSAIRCIPVVDVTLNVAHLAARAVKAKLDEEKKIRSSRGSWPNEEDRMPVGRHPRPAR